MCWACGTFPGLIDVFFPGEGALVLVPHVHVLAAALAVEPPAVERERHLGRTNILQIATGVLT